MAEVHEFKTFLYAFCGKRKVQPSYIVEEEDSGFYCEVKENFKKVYKLVLHYMHPAFSLISSPLISGSGLGTRLHYF